MNHPGFNEVCRQAGKRLIVHPIQGLERIQLISRGRSGYVQQIVQWILFRKHWHDLGPSARGTTVVVPFLDNISYAVGLLGSPFGSAPLLGIIMRPCFHWPEMGVHAPVQKHFGLQRRLFLRLLRNRVLRSLVTIDPSLQDWCVKAKPEGFERLVYREDPADLRGVGGRREALLHFGLKSSDQVILVFGAIDERKGLHALLEFINRPENRDKVLLVVGRQSTRARAHLEKFQNSGIRLIEVNQYVSSQEEWMAFQAANWVWIAYENFYGPSGVLSQAFQAGKPVIHNGLGLIGYLRKYRGMSRSEDIEYSVADKESANKSERECSFLSVQIYQIGSRRHYSVPLAVEGVGRLRSLITDFYIYRGGVEERVLKMLSNYKPARRALSNQSSLPENKVKSYQLLGYFTRFITPYAGRHRWLTEISDRVFGTLASWVPIPEGTVAFGFTHGSLEVFRKAKGLGRICILDQFDPAMAEFEIVKEAAEKWAGFNSVSPPSKRAYARLQKEWALADKIIVSSEWCKRGLVSQNVPEDKIKIIPLAYELAAVPNVRSYDGLRPLKVLWVGTCCLRKGFHILLECAKILKGAKIEFHVAGTNEIPEKTLDRYSDCRITYYGQVPKADSSKLYKDADVFVLPTLSDGFAITQLEAMALGLPVIATKNCGEVVEHERNGLIVEPGSVNSLLAAFERILGDPSFIEFASKGAISTMPGFSRAKYSSHILALLDELVSKT